jgi:threonine aldolase
MAQRLARGLDEIPGRRILYPVEANAVFVSLSPGCHQALAAAGWRYYTFIGQGGARFMCSWATTDQNIDALLTDIRKATYEEADAAVPFV